MTGGDDALHAAQHADERPAAGEIKAV